MLQIYSSPTQPFPCIMYLYTYSPKLIQYEKSFLRIRVTIEYGNDAIV